MYRPVAMEIVKSNQWEKALRNVTETPDGGYTTPMRRLISKMPGRMFVNHTHLIKQ